MSVRNSGSLKDDQLSATLIIPCTRISTKSRVPVSSIFKIQVGLETCDLRIIEHGFRSDDLANSIRQEFKIVRMT